MHDGGQQRGSGGGRRFGPGAGGLEALRAAGLGPGRAGRAWGEGAALGREGRETPVDVQHRPAAAAAAAAAAAVGGEEGGEGREGGDGRDVGGVAGRGGVRVGGPDEGGEVEGVEVVVEEARGARCGRAGWGQRRVCR